MARIELDHSLRQYFDLEDLRDLCYRLRVDYEELAGNTKSAKIRSLVQYFEHQGDLQPLIQAIEAARNIKIPTARTSLILHRSPRRELVGRTSLLSELQAVLLQASHLPVVLFGLPGVGKTELALHLVHTNAIQERFADGILWADLGRTGDVLSILGKWAASLGISQATIAHYQEVETLKEIITGVIGRKSILTVVDDVWNDNDMRALHIVGENCASLMTTRIRSLGWEWGEKRAFEIPQLSDQDSILLLSQFAKGVVSAEPAQAQALVQLVGGLPLALYLMGRKLAYPGVTHPGRLDATLQELHTRLGRLSLKVPREDLTLRAVISSSYDALESDSRQALQALSVFAPEPNSFSEAAAIAVAQIQPAILHTLYDFGLLNYLLPVGRRGQVRYAIHSTIADFANSQLTDDSIYHRFVDHYVSYIQENQNHYEALSLEELNIRQALEEAAKRKLAALIQGANSFYHFQAMRGRSGMIDKYLEQAQLIARQSNNVLGLGTTLVNRGQVAIDRGDYNQAQDFLQEGLTLSHLINNRDTICSALINLGVLAYHRGYKLRADALLNQGLLLARELNHDDYMVTGLANLGALAIDKGQFDRAKLVLEEALTLARRTRHDEHVSNTLLNLGVVAFRSEDLEGAETYWQEGLSLAKSMGYMSYALEVLPKLADLARQRGDVTRAEERLTEALAIAQEIGERGLISTTLNDLGEYYVEQQRLDLALQTYHQSLDIANSLQDYDLIAAASLGLARIAKRRGENDKLLSYGRQCIAALEARGNRDAASEVRTWLVDEARSGRP